MKKGYFITIEGCDGCGKSSTTLTIVNTLIKQGYQIVHTREPGGIDISEQIRNVILDVNNTSMDIKTEALLYAASRRQHLVEKVIPAIKENKIVICERFLDSSLAYQGYARGIGIDEVLSINKFAIGDNMPDLTIYMDVDPQVGIKRIANRSGKDRLDNEKLAFHQKVHEGYAIVNKMFKDRIISVDANQDADTVYNAMLEIIRNKIDE